MWLAFSNKLLTWEMLQKEDLKDYGYAFFAEQTMKQALICFPSFHMQSVYGWEWWKSCQQEELMKEKMLP